MNWKQPSTALNSVLSQHSIQYSISKKTQPNAAQYSTHSALKLSKRINTAKYNQVEQSISTSKSTQWTSHTQPSSGTCSHTQPPPVTRSHHQPHAATASHTQPPPASQTQPSPANLNHITHYKNNHAKPITLVNDVKIQLAKRRKQDFQKKINELVQTI